LQKARHCPGKECLRRIQCQQRHSRNSGLNTMWNICDVLW
jgi:hypothetical protein